MSSYHPSSTEEAIHYYGMCEGNVVRTVDGDGLLLHQPRLDGEVCVYLFRGGRKNYNQTEIERTWSNVDDWMDFLIAQRRDRLS